MIVSPYLETHEKLLGNIGGLALIYYAAITMMQTSKDHRDNRSEDLR
jgi:hypothetical protein